MALQIMSRHNVTFDEAVKVAKRMYLGYAEDKPLHEQYIEYIASLLKGDLGFSYVYKVPVIFIIASALPWTVFVLSISTLLSFTLGILLGLAAALKRQSKIGSGLAAYASMSQAIPDFLLAIILLMIFAIRLGILPTSGTYDPQLKPGFYPEFIISVFNHATLPVLSYTIPRVASWALLIKGNAANVLEEDFIKSAEARGLRGRRIMVAYIGRLSIAPLVALLAIDLGTMIGGSTLIENTFTYLGMGYYFSIAISRRDYGLMQGLFLISITSVIIANLIVDIIYPYIDPRARREHSK
jgi:peptide/nickel transport system permease protein